MSAATVSSTPLLMDPFFMAMESGTVRWADLLDDEYTPPVMGKAGAAAPAPVVVDDERIVKWWTDEYMIKERTQNWEVPDLTLCDDIRTHFPVYLESMPATEDGRRRFRIVFDAERVAAWACERAESCDEYVEYADWVQTRLVFALRQYGYKYTVESVGALDADYVAIVAMAHPSARRGRAAIPTLLGFPVTWTQDASDHTRHLVKPHLKRISESGVAPVKIAMDLLDALQECTDCTVEAAEPGSPYILVVTIPSAPAPVAVAPPAPRPVAPIVINTVTSRPRALDVMRANRLAWDREGRKHFIKHRARDQTRILAELAACGDCTIELTPADPQYMCVVTML